MGLFDDEYRGRRRSSRRYRERALPLMNTLEEETWSKKAARTGLSTLATAGEVLDIPGGFVRNSIADLAGWDRPEEGNITGRSSLEQLGLIGENVDQGWIPDMGDIAGFGYEVLTDPLLALGLGSRVTTPAGKALKAAKGMPNKSIIDAQTKALRLGKREARHMSARDIANKSLSSSTDRTAYKKSFLASAEAQGHSPVEALRMFSQDKVGGSFSIFGKPFSLPGAAKRAKRYDKIGAAARFSVPGRAAATMFNPPSAGQRSVPGQAVVGPAAWEGGKSAEVAARHMKHSAEGTLLRGGFDLKSQVDSTTIRRQLTARLEGTPYKGPKHADPRIAQKMDEALDIVAEEIRVENDFILKRARADGTSAAHLNDDIINLVTKDVIASIGYRARQGIKSQTRAGAESAARRAGKVMPLFDEMAGGKRKWRGFVGGTNGIEDAIADGRFSKESVMSLEERTDALGRDYMGWTDQEASMMHKLNATEKTSQWTKQKLNWQEEVLLDSLRKKHSHIEESAEMLSKFKEGTSPFPNSPIDDMIKRKFYADQTSISANGAHRLFGMTAAYGGPGSSLTDSLNSVKITGDNKIPAALRAVAHWGDDTSKEALERIFKDRGKKFDPSDLDGVEKGVKELLADAKARDIDAAAAGLEANYVKDLDDAINGFRIPTEIGDDARRLRDLWQAPAAAHPAIAAWDAFTSAFKTGVTTLWPGFHARNAYSEFWNNIVADGFDPRYTRVDPRRFSQPWVDARTIMRGGTIKGLSKIHMFKGMSDELATAKLGEMVAAHGMVDQGHFNEILKGAGEVASEVELGRVPGRNKQTLASEAIEGLKRGAWTPKAVRWAKGGFKDLPEGAPGWKLTEAGQGVGGNVESTARIATFLAKLRQGYSPEMAALASKGAHVDYSRLTDFERNVMRRLMPFYTWNRNQIPWQVRQFMQRPGGPQAQAIRAANMSRSDEFVPEWASTGMTAKFSEDEETGDRTFIGGLDLPHESMLEMLSLGPTGDQALKSTGLSMSGLIHPLIKSPIEYGTNSSTFRKGTKLTDLDPALGRTISNIAGSFGKEVNPRFIRDLPFGQVLEHAAMSTPLSRSVTSARKAFDPRKSQGEFLMNFLSGVRTSTVGKGSEDRALLNLLRETLEGKAGVGEFGNIYPKDIQALSPDDLERMRLYQTINTRNKRIAAEEKKKAKR